MKKSFIKNYGFVFLFFFAIFAPLMITVTSGLTRETNYMNTSRIIIQKEYISYSKVSDEEKEEYYKTHSYYSTLPNKPTLEDSINDTMKIIGYGTIAVVIVACGCAISNYRIHAYKR